jgi:NCAIR mutase (PurE)-related protein
MTPEEIRLILDAVRCGATSVEQIRERLAGGPGYLEVGESIKLDTDRRRRRGFPEVVFCASKRPEEVLAAVRALYERTGQAFATRCSPETATTVLDALGTGTYDPISRTLRVGGAAPRFTNVVTAVLAAGTSDRPVAEEACLTLETFGAPFERFYDVGVAGLHRLLDRLPQIERAGVVIVVAGMEGALPSVVGGLVRQPVIAVPASVGYGTALGGFTALFGMLTSCAGGITVVNIDNGFGAAMAALTILRAIREHGESRDD